MAESLTAATVAHVGSDGRLHAEKIDAIPDPQASSIYAGGSVGGTV
jgi:hypothetical protein